MQKGFALAAFLLTATSLWLPWWLVRLFAGSQQTEELAYRLYSQSSSLSFLPTLSGMLVVLAMFSMFVRIAGNSLQHEPERWQRDFRVAAGLLVIAACVVPLWAMDTPFWAKAAYDVDGARYWIHRLPGLGWWAALLAAACSVAASFVPKASD